MSESTEISHAQYNYHNKLWTYEFDAKIPMIFRNSKYFKQGVRSDAFFSNIDALPTLLELLGESVPEKIQGISQLPVLKGEKDSVRDVAYCESGGAGQQRKAVWHSNWKLLYRTGKGKETIELYNLAGDPQCRDKKNEMLQHMLWEIVSTEKYPNDMPERWKKQWAEIFTRF